MQQGSHAADSSEMGRMLWVAKLLITIPGWAQTEPGATVVTHHETIPNPVFGSAFRVAAACKGTATPCPWENAATWAQGVTPSPNSLVIVDGRVRIGTQSAQALEVGVYPGGTLSFDPAAATRLTTGSIVVFAGGRLEIGTEAAPVQTSAEVVIRDLAFSNDPKQHLRGVVVVDGVIRIHGRPLAEPFLRLTAEALRNQTALRVESPATAAGWRVGDAVVIPTSAQCAKETVGTCTDQTEDRTITAISTDGRTLTLSAALGFDHPGARDNGGRIDFLPHIIHKTRTVVLRSENPNGVRGHVLLHGRADADIRYASIRSFGRTDIRDLGPTNQKGRYPLHAHHLIGPRARPANGHQFTFLGNVIDFGAENRQQNRKWGLTVHGSHYGLVERNICDFASGAGIVTEDASETGNLFRKNFVVRVVGGNGSRTEDRDPGDGSKLGRAGVAYWFNGGGGNNYEDNVAAAVAECVYCYGYKFDNVYNSAVMIPRQAGDDPHAGEGTTVDSYTIGLRQFTRNEAYAVPNGITVWWVCTEFESPRDNCTSRMKDFRVWHHHRWGYFGYETNQMVIDGFVHRGDRNIIQNQHEGVTGLFLIDYMQRRTVVRNADIQGAAYAIIAPVHRDIRGSTGAENGITLIEDSYLVSGGNVDISAPNSTNGVSNLSPQTTILRFVRHSHPATRPGPDVSIFGNTSQNLTVRNDVRIVDHNSSAGGNGVELYLTPGYQPATSCNPAIGNCAADQAGSYPGFTGARVYALTGPTGTSAPYAPLGLTASPLGSNRIDLRWGDTAINETGFQVERKPAVGGAWGLLGATGSDTRNYSDTTVTPGTAYLYRVRAINGAGNSTYSNEATATAGAGSYSMRFHGNGVNAPGLDRVRIAIDDPANSLPGPPADIGETDFTIEFWMKGRAADNPAAAVSCGANQNWIYGNIIIDRDRYNQDRKFGVSIAGGRLVFGVTGSGGGDRTICGTSSVVDDRWHHVSVQRRRSDGWMWLHVDGRLEAQADGPDGDISYPDNGVPGNFCGGPCIGSDPYLVLGAEKHDAGASFPSYSGWMDELRLSTVLRYASDFTVSQQPYIADAQTAALFHFDEGAGDVVGDSAPGGASAGMRRYGGSPAGPEWSTETPFGGSSPTATCDVNQDGAVNVLDVQLMVNMILGVTPCVRGDLDGNGRCDVVDLQRIIGAVLGGGCLIGP
jgi:hypothetical protein